MKGQVYVNYVYDNFTAYLPTAGLVPSPGLAEDVQPTPTMETRTATVNLKATYNLNSSPSPVIGEAHSAISMMNACKYKTSCNWDLGLYGNCMSTLVCII